MPYHVTIDDPRTHQRVADAHNRNWKGDAIYQIDRTDPFATQSYTSLVPLAPRAERLGATPRLAAWQVTKIRNF